ncbi:MAG: HAMP domain-containing sensor histidine kinase [Ruegeria sp.]|nr:HAMP domain-containing sensor histidine kinase [Ruegeria sp.]
MHSSIAYHLQVDPRVMPLPDPEMQQILLIARSIAGETGHALLARLVESLSAHMNAAFVAITFSEGLPPTHARALYALRDGARVDDVRYSLKGTPCARVFAGEVLTVPCGIADLYPREAGFEGYIGIPLRNGDGSVMGHLAVFSDDAIQHSEVDTAISTIFAHRAEDELRRSAFETERKNLIADLSRLNARLQRGYSELRRENEQTSELMGLIAHDLRSPLAALISQAELGLSRTRAPTYEISRIEAAFQKVIDNADRIAQLIDATLERAREKGEVLSVNPELCDLCRLVSIAVEANRDAAMRKSIALNVVPACDILVEVDETLIVSAIDNLISNAVKYTYSQGSVQISVRLVDGDAVITVSDNGQGLTPDDQARVFGRFQTLSAKPTGTERSTGLGLANVRAVALAHGGSVHAESEGRGKGSSFRMTLPCRFGAQSATQTT